ncbi:MAG: hypothetical protein HYX78_10465 [Armatimonadetes bacterium]|nr:hypothetical protein [Armatimonadota bacterium]
MIPQVTTLPAVATTYYVSTTGDNSNPGAQAEPWADINYGDYHPRRKRAIHNDIGLNTNTIPDGVLGIRMDRIATRPVWANWATSLYKYCKNRKLYGCPVAVPQANVGTSAPTANTSISHMFNGIAIGRTTSMCRHPSRTAMLREYFARLCIPLVRPWLQGQDTNIGAYSMHKEGSNFLFADGHVKMRDWKRVPYDPNKTFWNYDGGWGAPDGKTYKISNSWGNFGYNDDY